MTLKRPAQSTRTHEPFWYPNARTRLRALLPELALSVVLMTCTTVTIGYSEDVSMALLIAIMALIQMWVQPVLYGCTYLVRDTRAFFVPLALIALPMPIYIIGWAAFLPVESFGALDFAIPLSVVIRLHLQISNPIYSTYSSVYAGQPVGSHCANCSKTSSEVASLIISIITSLSLYSKS